MHIHVGDLPSWVSGPLKSHGFGFLVFAELYLWDDEAMLLCL